MSPHDPGEGQVRVSNELAKRGVLISPTGVRSVWLRHELQTFQKRLKALEAEAAKNQLILTEEQVRALKKARQMQISVRPSEKASTPPKCCKPAVNRRVVSNSVQPKYLPTKQQRAGESREVWK